MEHVDHSQPVYRRQRSNSVINRMTKSEKIWGIIGIFLLIAALDGGLPAFIPILIFVIIAHSFSQREKLKDHLEILMGYYPETTVGFLAKQTDKEEDKVIEAIKIMILDEGAPIRLDLVNKTVTKLDVSSQGTGSSNAETPVRTYSQPVQTTSARQPIRQAVGPDLSSTDRSHQRSQEQVARQQVEVKTPMSACIQCGVQLPLTAKYCNNCGVRQYT